MKNLAWLLLLKEVYLAKMLNSMIYSIKQAFIQVFRNRAMSLASIFSITAMLLILGLFFIAVVNINMATEASKKDYETVQVYLLDETTFEDSQLVKDEFDGSEGVESTEYLNKDAALAKWKSKWGESGYLLDSLSNNPLPNSILVTVSELEAADKVVKTAKTMDGIEDIKYYKDTVEKLLKITNFIQISALIIMAFLIIVSVVVVSNTIKLTVLARSREIHMMKYVGATNWFIRGPFLVEGILIGIISALISVCIIAFSYSKISEMIGQDVFIILSTPIVSVSFMTMNLVIIFLAVGVSIGACGSIISMRRFLDTYIGGYMKRILVFTLTFALMVSLFNFGFSYATKASQKDLSNVKNEISDAQKKLNEGKSVEIKLNKDISSLENQINQTQNDINNLKGNIDATQDKINEALAQLAQVEEEMAIQNQQLSSRLRIMYKNGGVGVLDVILGSDSISDFMTNMDMVQRIYESDKEVLKAMETQYAIIAAQREYLVNLQAQLEIDRQEEATKQNALQADKSQVAVKKSEVSQNNKALQEQINALYAEANRLTREIQSLQRGGNYSGGIMSWPVQGRISSPFGYRTHPILKTRELHTGIDIAARSGTTVVAANKGTVIKSSWNNSYGNLLMIDHGGSIVSLYAHNSSLLVSVGDVVSKGQAVSKVGSTGMSTGTHLHFEVRVNGQYKNPMDWL